MDGYTDHGTTSDLYWHCEELASTVVFDELSGGPLEVCARHAEELRDACPWTSADECAMAAEREVAGTNASIPGCVTHGR
jgi:hypothetical protein